MTTDRPFLLVQGPVKRRQRWLDWVNEAVTAGELESLRRSVVRGAPFGDPAWTKREAAAHGLQPTLRPRGRPAKAPTEKKH
jgi:putative transposase